MSAMTHASLQTAAGDSSGLVLVQPPEVTSELDDFVYIVSHDVRNSARALTEVPQWIREDLDDQGVALLSDTRENFDLLERHAKRLDQMLLDLLVYSRVGRLQETVDVSFSDVLGEVIDECTPPDRVKVSEMGELPCAKMGRNDAFVLLKCVLDNVIRHSRGRPITLQVKGCRSRDGATLDFLDDGPGIAPDDLTKLFRPMTTGVRRDEVDGSGMGLAIIHRIALHYEGNVWAGPGPQNTGLQIRVRLRDPKVGSKADTGSDVVGALNRQ